MKNQSFYKYLTALLIFGSNGIVASFIALGSLQIVLLRTLIGSVFLVGMFLLLGNRFTFLKHKKQLVYIAISGIALGTGWIFLYEAYARIGVGISSLLYYCGPVIVMALSPVIFKEKLTSGKIVGFIAVLAGIFLINGKSDAGAADVIGIACGLAAAVLYAVMVIFNKKATDITGIENSTLQIVFAFLAVAVFTGIKQGYAMEITSESILPIAVLGVLNTGVGCLLYFSAIGKLPVQTVSVCGYLEPLSAVFFSVLILKETLAPMQILGAALVLGGAMMCELMAEKRIALPLPRRFGVRDSRSA